MSELLLEVKRGGVVESRHYGSYVVIDRGKVVRSRGDIDRVTFMRSSAKPIQCYSVVESGAADRFGLDEREIAVIVGSHSGEPIHIKTVSSILRKGGLKESDLLCGKHKPLSEKVVVRKLTQLHNNCSGKHSGMLLLAKMLGVSIKKYTDKNHPVQKRNIKNMARFANIKASSIKIGIDGCSAPTFGLSVKNMGFAFANFCSAMDSSATRIANALKRYPEMIAANGRICTELIRATNGRLLTKIGAEGVYCCGVVNKGIGIAMKIDDGSSRPIAPVLITLLSDMGFITKEERRRLAPLEDNVLRNHAGLEVGRTIVRI